jgi:hypothetical protein
MPNLFYLPLVNPQGSIRYTLSYPTHPPPREGPKTAAESKEKVNN